MSEITYNTLDGVVVNKETLLKVLKDNREKHNAIYEVACSGFWINAQEAIESKKDEFLDSLKKSQQYFNIALLKTNQQLENKDKNISLSFSTYLEFNPNLGLKYPENHEADYNTIIRKLELSTAKEIKLTDNEFHSYVMNNWAWKNNFISTNSAYVNKISTSMLCSGGNNTVIGGYSNILSKSVAISGCSIF